ncbi:hypothetical protein LBBP_02841 [Leptospira borgpetersenii serovar Ballum]|uniref:Uncharacterized protein n=1 Tax=Leptospira borgpetersenii serovar Ballum TaxID=280505 RepID=A0A0S2ITS0_LEPBO|nr:hypothetical protein LBBP_02841 [Leptospira borgpetersenii serovar Ballum]
MGKVMVGSDALEFFRAPVGNGLSLEKAFRLSSTTLESLSH